MVRQPAVGRLFTPTVRWNSASEPEAIRSTLWSTQDELTKTKRFSGLLSILLRHWVSMFTGLLAPGISRTFYLGQESVFDLGKVSVIGFYSRQKGFSRKIRQGFKLISAALLLGRNP